MSFSLENFDVLPICIYFFFVKNISTCTRCLLQKTEQNNFLKPGKPEKKTIWKFRLTEDVNTGNLGISVLLEI